MKGGETSCRALEQRSREPKSKAKVIATSGKKRGTTSKLGNWVLGSVGGAQRWKATNLPPVCHFPHPIFSVSHSSYPLHLSYICRHPFPPFLISLSTSLCIHPNLLDSHERPAPGDIHLGPRSQHGEYTRIIVAHTHLHKEKKNVIGRGEDTDCTFGCRERSRTHWNKSMSRVTTTQKQNAFPIQPV